MPELLAVLGIHGGEALLGEENNLAGAENGGGDRGGVSDSVVAALPLQRAGGFVEGEECRAGAAAADDHEIALDERRDRVLPGDVPAAVVFGHILVPELLAGLAVKAVEIEAAAIDIDSAAVVGRRAAGAVAAFVIARALVAAALVFRQFQRHGPEFLAVSGVKGHAVLRRRAFEIARDQRGGHIPAHRDAAESVRGRRLPELLRSLLVPCFAKVRSGDAIATGPAICWPFTAGGGGFGSKAGVEAGG